MLDSYIVHTDLKNEVGNKLRQLWWYCWTKITGMIDISLLSRINVSIPFAVDLHLPCARAEYEIIREIRQTVIHIDDDKRTNFAYEQLREKSFYGEFIKEILNNSELFAHYYHDQLTLARNEANIHRLPTSFIQRLLTVNILQTNKDRLQLLLIDYKEFFEILRLYEISVPLIDEQNTVSDILHRQFFLHTIQRDSTLITNDKLYQLLSQDSNYYLIPPGSSDTSEETFDCGGNPYIEISLMNIVELLLLPTVIDRLTDLQQTMLIYGRFAQIMLKLLSFGHYEVKNFKKFNSIIRLASCISCLFTNDEATIVFKKLYRINGDCSQLNTCNQIHNFILSLYNIIHKQQSTVDEETIHETLSKLEVELLRNWLFDNDKNSYEILDIINKSDQNLWKFSSKLFDFINQRFGFSAIFNEDDWQIPNDDDIEKLKTDLVQSNDPMNKIELLLINTIYVRLIFNENYQSKFNGISPRKLTEVLEMGFDRFDNSLTTNDQIQNEKKLERICFIAWLKYYLLHYVYAYQNNITNEIIQNINLSLLRNTTPFCSTIKLYIIKHLCHLQNTTVYYLGKDCAEKEITWLQAMIPQSADANPQHSRKHVTLPTPLFVFAKSFKHIDDNLSKIKDSSAMIDLIQKCSKNQTETYCFIMWFVHYYTRYWISNVSTEKTSFEYTGEGVKEELIKHYDIIGQKLIFGLVNNFDENSYFHLNDSMSEKDLHSRLLVLNIIAALISFKLTKKPSFFSSLLFDTKLEMPQNYIEHFEQLFNIRDLSLDSNTLDYIDTYIKKQKLEGRSNIAENSLTHHFMNFLIQSIYLVLCELDCMPCSTSIIRHEYRKKIQDKYNQLEEHFLDVHQSYLWFYNLVIYIVNENFASKTEFHSNIELLEKLIIFHGPSAITEIKQYQSAYLDFVFGQEKNNQLVTFVDELIEDNDKYSLLNFFNFSNIHSIDVIDHFYRQLRLQYNYKTNYPITNLIFERLSDYDNIQYLYPIIQLINELIQKYDHQIKRADANEKTIGECLKNDENLEAIFKNCLDAWYAITLKEVQRERPPLEHNVKDCSLSMFLLNKNNEGKNMAITHTIKTLVDLQNSMFDCFYSNASKTTEDTEYQMIPVQSIQQRHLFNYGTKKLRQLLIEKALVINYMYGVSEQIIFNYDEIEWSLRNEINCLSKIDMKNTRNLNYQYELYDENFSLFSEIRKRFLLILFSASKRDELREKLKNFEASDIVKISESLNYILSLLCATNIKNISEVSTIKTFIDKHIQLKECIHEKLADGMFGSIELVSIIDLYELVEETRFDKTLRKQFEQKLDTGLNLKPTDRTNILNQFMETVLNNKNGPTSLKNIHSWIGMFKRLLVRVCSLIMSNNYNSPLQVYVRRTDMWKSDISEESIETIKMEDNICLKHAYIILERLETDTLPAKQNKTAGNKVPKNKKMTYDG